MVIGHMAENDLEREEPLEGLKHRIRNIPRTVENERGWSKRVGEILLEESLGWVHWFRDLETCRIGADRRSLADPRWGRRSWR